MSGMYYTTSSMPKHELKQTYRNEIIKLQLPQIRHRGIILLCFGQLIGSCSLVQALIQCFDFYFELMNITTIIA
jgi:hypothetical protein